MCWCVGAGLVGVDVVDVVGVVVGNVGSVGVGVSVGVVGVGVGVYLGRVPCTYRLCRGQPERGGETAWSLKNPRAYDAKNYQQGCPPSCAGLQGLPFSGPTLPSGFTASRYSAPA